MCPTATSDITEGGMSTATKAAHDARAKRSSVTTYNALKGLEAYEYPRLRTMQRRIRLLKLSGGSLDNPEITCKLFEVEFGRDGVVRDPNDVVRDKNDPECGKGRAVRYEALSWCWGNEGRELGIRMTGMDGNAEVAFRYPVTRELGLALKYLRRPQDRILWIDAICINQEDHEERNHQVQMMALIYNSAAQVCVWLGEDNDDSATAILFVREIMMLENFDAISENKENASKWQSLLLLMQRPWFSRRWVVQEIALARRATIYCGIDELPWENFAVAVELFVEVETATHRLSEVMKKTEAFGHVPQWFEHVSELGASVLVQATGKVFRRDGGQKAEQQTRSVSTTKIPRKRGPRFPVRKKLSAYLSQQAVRLETPSPPRPLLSLEYLVSSLSIFQATQPRDAVYSLLAISRDTSPLAELSPLTNNDSEEAIIMATVSSFLERKPFRVDYSRPYSDVCKDFIAYCINRAKSSDPSRALDILCRPWAPEPPALNSSVSSVTHKKPIRYKLLKKNRQALWKPSSKEPRKRKLATPPPDPNSPNGSKHNPESQAQVANDGNAGLRNRSSAQNGQQGKTDQAAERWVEDTRGLKKYFDDAFIPPDHEEWLVRVSRALPGKLRQSTQDNEDGVPDEGVEDDDDNDQEEEEEEKDLALPTWVSSISGAAFALFHHPGMHSMMRMGRKNADPLVGLPVDGHRNYSAAQNTKVDQKKLKFRKRQTLEHHSLYVSGFVLDEIEEVAEPARLGAIPKTWPKLAGWEDAVDGDSDPPAEFWRTLVADRGKDNRNPPYYYATACKESVKKGGLTSGSVDTGALISSERNSIIAEFCRRVQAVIWNRRLIKTKGNRLGLTGEDVKPGDLVCIIFGCTVPVILRRGKRKTADEIRDEEFVDQLEAMRRCMARKEQRCFQRLRYDKIKDRKTEEDRKLGLPKELSQAESYIKEIQEEQKAINEQITSWENEDLEASKRRKGEEKAKQDRKREAEKRVLRRKKALEERQTRIETIQRSQTAPGSDRNGMLVDMARSSTVGLNGDGKTMGLGHNVPTSSNGHTKPADSDGGEKAQKDAAKEDREVWYKLQGEAYIHGMMDGEAIRERIMEAIPERLFEIR